MIAEPNTQSNGRETSTHKRMAHSDLNRQVAASEKSFNRFSLKRSAVLCGLWLLTSSVAGFSRLTHPAFGIQGDLPLHYHFARSYLQSFDEGDWWPRWAGLLDGGRGDALFTFYPPAPYLLSTLFIKLFKVEILTSLKLVCLLSLLIAQACAYLLAREFFSFRRSLIVSLVYVLLPAYPLIAFQRAFFANALALALMPMCLLGAHLLLTGKRQARGLAIFAFSFSAVILTHAITTYLSGLAIAIMTIVYLWRADRAEVARRGIWRLLASGIIVLALTAFFLWPQRAEIDWVQVERIAAQHDYHHYFLFAKAADESSIHQVWADLNYLFSLITIAQTLMAGLLGLLCRRLLKSHTAPDSLASILWFALALTAAGLFISLPFSDPLWRYLPGLKFIQFPWRFQPFVSLACALLAAAAAGAWSLLRRGERTLIVAALTWLIIANATLSFMLLRLNRSNINHAQVISLLDPLASNQTPIDESWRIQNRAGIKVVLDAANQAYFRPRGADANLYPPTDQPGGLSFLSGQGRLISQQLAIAHRDFTLEISQPARALISTYHYPHWIARLDDRPIPITPLNDDPSRQGLISLELPPGTHRLSLDFEITNLGERIARRLSLVAWLLFIAWIIRQEISGLARTL